MKRKVKFQEGGEVGSGMTAAERRRAALEQARQSRSFESQRRIPRRAPSASADALRSGAGMTPSAGGSAMSRMAPRAGGILGLLGLAPLALEAYRAVRDRERPQEDLDIAEAYRTGRDVREIQAQRAAREGRGVFPGETPETTPSPAPEATPAPTSQSTPARSQPTRRPTTPARRESTSADDLNAMVLRLQSGVAPQTETERRLADRMGIAYRKGGLVKPKASVKKMKTGGKVAPKKMMKGGITSKPKVKPAKYAKGGMTKGRK